MSESKRPWTFSPLLSGSENHKGYSIRDASGIYLGTISPMDPDGRGGAAVAGTIVRSVNSRDLAVEAMEEALRHLDVGIPEGRHLHTIAKLRSALAELREVGR